MTADVGMQRMMMNKEIIARYLMATVLTSAFAAFMAFTSWVLNQSTLPPGGGGWKLVVLIPCLSWLVVFALVVVHDKTRSRKFSLKAQTENNKEHSNKMPDDTARKLADDQYQRWIKMMTAFSKKAMGVVALVVLIQTALWFVDGRERIYRQVSSDARWMLSGGRKHMSKREFREAFPKPWTAVVLRTTADRIGTRGMEQLTETLKSFKASLAVRSDLPRDQMPEGELALVFKPLWSCPFLGKTELTLWNAGCGYWIQDHYHLYMMGVWLRIGTGSGGVG